MCETKKTIERLNKESQQKKSAINKYQKIHLFHSSNHWSKRRFFVRCEWHWISLESLIMDVIQRNCALFKVIFMTAGEHLPNYLMSWCLMVSLIHENDKRVAVKMLQRLSPVPFFHSIHGQWWWEMTSHIQRSEKRTKFSHRKVIMLIVWLVYLHTQLIILSYVTRFSFVCCFHAGIRFLFRSFSLSLQIKTVKNPLGWRLFSSMIETGVGYSQTP